MFVQIYKLIKKDATNDDMVYIGSTKDIDDRIRRHKNSCNNPNGRDYNLKIYKYIRDNGGWDEWTYEIIDEIEVALRDDAKKYEGQYILKYDAINKLNDVVAGRSKKEYYEQNKEHLLQKHKEWLEQNKEQLSQKHKEWLEQNKEQLSQYRKERYESNKEQILQKQKEWYERDKEQRLKDASIYRELNRALLAQKQKEFRENNKEKLAQKRKEKYERNKEQINERRREKYKQLKNINHTPQL